MNMHHLLQHFGYVGVFTILLLEMVGIPFPAETTLTLSGIEWARGDFSLVPLLLAAALGNIVGSSIAYLIGLYLGRPVILRLGKYVGITEEKLNRAEEKFQRYQNTLVLFAKFIAGVRVLVPYLAGINKMQWLVFTIYNAVSAVVWVAVFVILGRYLGHEWTKYHVLIRHFLTPILLVIFVLIVLYVVWKIWRKRK